MKINRLKQLFRDAKQTLENFNFENLFWSKDSLINEIDSKMTINNPSLLKSKKDHVIDNLDGFGKWSIFIIVVALFFVPGLINIEIINFIRIDDSSVKNLINSRTTDIITMISIVFMIIGFIVQYLAIQEGLTYKIVFKVLSFMQIIYMALSLIICFIILSTLGDWLPLKYQAKALLTGTYLIFVIIFLIGYLFTQLLKFADSKDILSALGKEYLLWIKQSLILHFTKEIASCTPNRYKSKSGVIDVKIKKMCNLIDRIDESNRIVFFDIINKLRHTEHEDEIKSFLANYSNNINITKTLSSLEKCVAITRKKYNYIDCQGYILNKLEKCIETNDGNMSKKYLDILYEAYKINYQFKAEDYVDSTFYYDRNYILPSIQKLNKKIGGLITKSIERNNRDVFDELDKFCYEIMKLSIDCQNIKLFESYLSYIRSYYSIARFFKQSSKESVYYKYFSEQSAERIHQIYTEFSAVESTIADIELSKQFRLSTYTEFSRLLYLQVKSNDSLSFKFTIDKITETPPDLDFTLTHHYISDSEYDKTENYQHIYYKIDCILGIRHWLYYLYINDHITIEDLNAFFSEIYIYINHTERNLIFPPDFHQVFGIITMLDEANSPNSNYLDWDRWGYYLLKNEYIYSIPIPSTWICDGYIIDCLKDGLTHAKLIKELSDFEDNNEQMGNKEELKIFFISLRNSAEKIRDKEYDRWVLFIKEDLKTRSDEIVKRINKCIELFENYENS